MPIAMNADIGESFGPWVMGRDADIVPLVDSVNIACGFHAGDPDVMRRTVALAQSHGVSIGAHPAYPDLQGFGRREMRMPAAEVTALVSYQIGALAGVAALESARVTHVKPHGSLNNMASVDPTLAGAIVAGMRAVDPRLILLAPTGSALITAAEQAGQPVVAEVFADRTYTDTGALTPRAMAGAVLTDPSEACAHVLRMVEAQALFPLSGMAAIPAEIGSVCVHGDGAEAVETARRVRDGLLEAGITLASLIDIADR